MGLLDTDVCPQLCKLTYDHLGKFEGVKIGSMIILFIFFANIPENLNLKLIE
jgi:hypothetical protein